MTQYSDRRRPEHGAAWEKCYGHPGARGGPFGSASTVPGSDPGAAAVHLRALKSVSRAKPRKSACGSQAVSRGETVPVYPKGSVSFWSAR